MARLIDADELNWRLGVNQDDKQIFYSKLFKMRPFPAVERLQGVPGVLQTAVGRAGQ